MRELVRALVRSELAGAENSQAGTSAISERARAAAAPSAFVKVFQRLSLAPRSRAASTDNSAAEAVIVDLISDHLLKNKSATGADPHLHFNGLRKRMLDNTVLRDPWIRRSILEVIFTIGGTSTDNAKVHASLKAFDDFPGLGLGAKPSSRPTVHQPTAPGVQHSASRKPSKPQTMAVEVSASSVLGWHIAGAGNSQPAAISEEKLLRGLLHALQGVESECFRYSEEDKRFHVDSSYVFSRPVSHMVHILLELGNMHQRLVWATAHNGEMVKSLLQQALFEALREQLRDYYKVLALLMSKVSGAMPSEAEVSVGPAELTLRRLWSWLQAPMERMRLLDSLAESCAPLRGGALASTVYGCSRVGDTPTQDVCGAILRRVAGPLLTMMRAWMTEGELRDPYAEFFVCANASVPLEDLWTRMYTLDIQMVPSFITLDLARKILLTGKSVNFIQLCCARQEADLSAGGFQKRKPNEDTRTYTARTSDRPLSDRWLSSSKGIESGGLPQVTGFSTWERAEVDFADRKELPLTELSSLVEQAALRTNKYLVSLMFERYALGEHSLALRRFILLGQGDFVESLLDASVVELSKNAGDVYKHQLKGVLDMVLRQTYTQWFSPEILGRLDVKLLQASGGEKVWDTFLLDYAIDSPLHVVFTPAAMQKYDRAFSFLWRLRRVSHSLAKCWGQQMALQRHVVSCNPRVGLHAPELRLEMRQTLHKCTCLRNEIHHFVQNIQSYVMCEVLETSWAKLQSGWQVCVDLDQVITEHQRYLTSLEDGAFLSEIMEPILTSVNGLLSLGLEFSQLHDQVCLSAFEALEVMMSDPAGPKPFARTFAESRAQLDQLGAGFLARLQTLLKTLEAQSSMRQMAGDLGFLACRLDSNGYYEQKQKRSLM